MLVLWILLYVIGFVATTITMKYFKLGPVPQDGDWWMAVFMWPLFVPISLCVMFITRIACTTGSWWDKVSDEIVEKLKDKSPRSSAD